jgi:hypothetical protein
MIPSYVKLPGIDAEGSMSRNIGIFRIELNL